MNWSRLLKKSLTENFIFLRSVRVFACSFRWYFVIVSSNQDHWNGTLTQIHFVCKRTFNHKVKLTKWLCCVMKTYLCGLFVLLTFAIPLYKLRGCGFESRYSYLILKYQYCSKQGVFKMLWFYQTRTLHKKFGHIYWRNS